MCVRAVKWLYRVKWIKLKSLGSKARMCLFRHIYSWNLYWGSWAGVCSGHQLVKGVKDRVKVLASLQQLVVLCRPIQGTHQLGRGQQVRTKLGRGPGYRRAAHWHHGRVEGQFGLHGLLLHLSQDRVGLDEAHLRGENRVHQTQLQHWKKTSNYATALKGTVTQKGKNLSLNILHPMLR